ncbi:RpiB/LacA/LacB family sugar-phosphate isomerase [Candidatus Pacearchaeota archaeon]|nr:RpiB/LacA/LacB family sugar-phosphate isomerase [Candidatus Pacearchaeota archaeon]
MEIFIGSDHAGFDTKEKIKKYFKERGVDYEDLGVGKLEKLDDYPIFAFRVAEKVAKSKGKSFGILVCGTGTGMAIAANKVPGIRAVAAYDAYSAKMSRLDNNANILGLRGRNFSFNKIKKIINTWLNTSFSFEERHKRRLRKIEMYESKRFK